MRPETIIRFRICDLGYCELYFIDGKFNSLESLAIIEEMQLSVTKDACL